MAETYCGKSCMDCSQKVALNCPGCRTGPGRYIGGDCDLAKCVRGKGHETCETCGFRVNCGTLRSRDYMANYRLRRIEAEEARKAAIARRAVVLGKWLWILFWLIVPSTVGSIMANDAVAEIWPGVSLAGQILSAACFLAYGAILLKLGVEEDCYRVSGICALISGGITTVAALVSGTAESSGWMLLITVPAAIVALVGEYNEYTGHAAVLDGADDELAEKWSLLWKWYIGLEAGAILSLLILVVAPILGALAALGTAIGLVVVGILKFVYLYRTAKLFREYPVGV